MKTYTLSYTHLASDTDHEVSFIAENDEQALVLKARFEAEGHVQNVDIFDINDNLVH